MKAELPKTAATLLVASLMAATTMSSALADGDAAAGEKVFKKCQACHVVDSDKNRVGPTLKGVVGRTPGTAEGFKYSKPMIAFGEGGAVWDEETLSAYLENPKAVVPKNKMSFPGLKKPEERADVIAYLMTFSE